jgi:hypothetical protein
MLLVVDAAPRATTCWSGFVLPHCSGGARRSVARRGEGFADAGFVGGAGVAVATAEGHGR